MKKWMDAKVPEYEWTKEELIQDYTNVGIDASKIAVYETDGELVIYYLSSHGVAVADRFIPKPPARFSVKIAYGGYEVLDYTYPIARTARISDADRIAKALESYHGQE